MDGEAPQLLHSLPRMLIDHRVRSITLSIAAMRVELIEL
jgi:hypothetical protein